MRAVFQSIHLQAILDFCAVGMEVITSLIIVLMMSFLKVEKNLAKEQNEILLRHKEETLKNGKEWIEPEEKERLEREEFERLEEESYLDSLKKKCEKKGWDYESRKASYLAEKEAKNESK